MKNLNDNIINQAQENTIVEFSSFHDFHRPITLENRVEYLQQLYAIYGVTYTHTVTLEEEQPLKEFISQVEIKYLAKLKCTEDVLVKEFKSIWPILNRSWLKHKDDKKAGLKQLLFFILKKA